MFNFWPMSKILSANFGYLSIAAANASRDTLLRGFTNSEAENYAKKFNMPIGYNADADRKSWAEMQSFFKDIFRK